VPNKLRLETTLQNFLNGITFTADCKIAIAVSGGADSLALAFSLKSFEKQYGYRLIALHVNHKLRAEALTEATQVKQWMNAAGIPCYILEWEHAGISTKIQEQARDARYNLISTACKAQNIKGVFLGHHKEDQYETILYRLSCATGPDGLAGIPPISIKQNIPYLRPCLPLYKKDLVDYLENHPFIKDPSNANLKYTRVKFRQETDHLTQLGLTIDTLVDVAGKAAQNRLFVEGLVDKASVKYTQINPLGYATLDPALFKEINFEIQHRLLNNLLMKIGGNTSPLRQKNLKEFLEKFHKNTAFKGESIGNCLIRPYKKEWLIIREPEKISDKKPVDNLIFWDNRFIISGLEKNENHFVAALGGNWGNYKKVFSDIAQLPSYFWQTIPAIYDKNGVVLEIILQDRGNSDSLTKGFNIEFSPYCMQHKSIFDLTKRITL
tara:strand:+ start:4726 stop:6036 length:1311 start_codon:yes stop_codon:yes gene_type:complete